jgi:hypothetical protein
MSFKKLGLNREKINEAISSFSTEANITGPIAKPNDLYIYTLKLPAEPEATLNIYYTKDGNTTIMTTNGKNSVLSEKVAAHVVKNCEYKNIPEKPLYLKKISDEEFDMLLEFLKDFNVTIEDGSNIQYGKQYKVISPYGDYLYLNKYEKGSFQVQGPSKIAKAWVIEGLTSFLPYKEIIDIQLKSLDVEISPDAVVSEMQQALPTAYDFLGDTLVAITSPAVALQSINVELKDYTAFVFPALKGLEGYIKKLFLENGILISRDGFGDHFQESSMVQLTQDAKNTIGNHKVVKAIEDSYKYFKRQRHGLFHVDGTIDTTRLIERKMEAEKILSEVFDVIEKTYSNIVR